MLEFIIELDRILKKWPENNSWSISQLADYTNTSHAQLIDCLSEILEKELTSEDLLTLEEASNIARTLKEKYQIELARRERYMKERQKKALERYDLTMEKVRVLQIGKNFHSAYRTLSYFVGHNEKDLPDDFRLTLYGDCLRLGKKAQINLQELGLWLKKGVDTALQAPSGNALEEVMDFVDAYREFFLDGKGSKGEKLLTNVFCQISQTATLYNLKNEYEKIVKELHLPPTIEQAISGEF